MNALFVAALASHLVRDPAPLSPSAWRRVRDALGPAATLGEAALRNAAERALAPSEFASAEGRLALLDDVRDAVNELAAQGIGLVCEMDADYPAKWLERIARSAPPLLFVAGEPTILRDPTIGVVGSREVDSDAAEWATDVAREIVRLGFSVVSGGARGIDRIAATTALGAGGRALAILADSLVRAHVQAVRESAYAEGGLCQCTPYAPDAPFSVGNAMGRNKLVYAHSTATVVVTAAEGTGGTWAGAVEALRGDLSPVLVWDREDLPGNQKLIRMGGRPLRSAAGLVDAIDSSGPMQGSLF